MFKKPAGYDETTATAETTPRLPAGGYICEVIAAEVRKSRRGAEMLVLSVDVAAMQGISSGASRRSSWTSGRAMQRFIRCWKGGALRCSNGWWKTLRQVIRAGN